MHTTSSTFNYLLDESRNIYWKWFCTFCHIFFYKKVDFLHPGSPSYIGQILPICLKRLALYSSSHFFLSNMTTSSFFTIVRKSYFWRISIGTWFQSWQWNIGVQKMYAAFTFSLGHPIAVLNCSKSSSVHTTRTHEDFIWAFALS